MPMSRELRKASESSIRKSQEVRQVTRMENEPAGESIGSNAWLCTTSSWPANSGAVRLSRRAETREIGSEDMRYFSLGVCCEVRDANSFFPIFQAGNNLAYMYRDRKRTILFLYVRGSRVPRFWGRSCDPLDPNWISHLSTITSGLDPSLVPPEELGDEFHASSTSQRLPLSSTKMRL